MPVYLDYNATTAIDPRVVEAMLPYMSAPHGNPSSVHRYGRYSRAAIDTAREQVAQFVNAHPAEVVFTSGGTEADNLAIKGVMLRLTTSALAFAATEHHAVLEPAEWLQAGGRDVVSLPVDSDGLVAANQLEKSIIDAGLAGVNLGLVSVMWANSETGVIQPVRELADQSHQHGALFHTDAVQAAGKVDVDFAASGVDLLSLSAHKIYGPKGVGALVRKKTVDLMPLQHGGGQERGARAGTENVPAIVGFGKAAELAHAELQTRMDHCRTLRDELESKLVRFSGLQVFSKNVERLPNTTMVGVPGFDAETLLMELDRKGVAVSSGSACSSGSAEPSHVLVAMKAPEPSARGAIRISFGVSNTQADVDAFISALSQVLIQFGHKG